MPVFAQSPAAHAKAEMQVVKGTVIDDFGEPIIGAYIQLLSNPRLGTTTGLDGTFEFRCTKNDRLKISFIGYATQVISTNQTEHRIVMHEEVNSLEETVVYGYGALKQKNVTGSMEVITAEQIQDLSVSNLSEALVAVSPAVHVSLASTGRPGETSSITIRQASQSVKTLPTGVDAGGQALGANTSASPLYVIDGFQSTEDEFNNLDIEEIEGIVILKDGAAAVYGAQASYGVIEVKTKRGKKGTPKINYRAQLSYVDAIRHADMLSGYDYGRIYNAAQAAKTGQASVDNNVDVLTGYFQADELEAMKSTNYDLLDKYWSGSFQQKHTISLNGGSDNVSYNASVAYFTQDGNIGKLDYDRWNYRAGLTAKVGKLFDVTLNVSGNTTDKNSHMASAGGSGDEEDYLYLLQNPSFVPDEINGYPIYHSGMENSTSFDNYYNYKSLLNSRNNQETYSNSMTIQGVIEHDFGWWKPLKGLHAKVTYSRNVQNDEQNNIRMENTVYRVINRGGSGKHLYVTDPTQIIDNDPDVDYDEETLEGFAYTSFENLEARVLNSGQNSYLSRSMSRGNSYQLNFQLSYAREFGDHDLSALFNVEKCESESEDVYAEATHPLAFTDGQSSSLADDTEKDVSWSRSESGRLSYIYRLNYAYKSKYLAEFMMRQEASTKFAPENYWGSFPSLSLGWVPSQEGFWDPEKTKIDFLKFRLSYSLLGHDDTDAWRWKQLYSYNAYGGAIFGTDYTQTTSRSFQLPEKSGTNRDLHWSKYHKFNLGADARMLDSRLSAELDIYLNLVRDKFDYPSGSTLPGTVGIYPAPENYQDANEWGGEISLQWNDKIGKDFRYLVKVGFDTFDNRLLKHYGTTTPDFDDMVDGQRYDRGLWGLSCIGMFRSQVEIDEYFDRYGITEYLGMDRSRVQPGMLIYEDIRGSRDEDGNWTAPDGKIVADEDLVKLSNRADNAYRGYSYFNFQYKGMTLYFTIQAEWGAYKLMSSNLRGESFDNMQTTNVSKMWKNMFVYEDAYDASGNQIVWENRDGNMPNLRYASVNSRASTFWRIPATDVSLRNLTFAYNLPKQWTQKAGMSNVRLNVTCSNVCSLYNPYKDNVWNDFAGSYGSYPRVRTITGGVSVTF